MTTEENFFVRQDVTGFFTMLQGIRTRVWGGDSGPGAGWGGDSGPARSVVGIRAPGTGWGGDSGPGAATWWGGIRARGAGGVEIFGVRWEIFYLFAVFSSFG